MNSGKSIAWSLVGLVLVALVPLLVFGGGVAWIIIDQEERAFADELAATASALRVAVDRELLSQFAAMDVLATDFSLDGGNLLAFTARAQRVLAQRKEWRSVSLIDPRSRLMIASTTALPTPAPTTMIPAAVDQVARTGKPLIAGVFSSATIIREPVILLLMPVSNGGGVRYVIAVGMHPDSLSRIFAEQQLRPTWTGAVVAADMTLAGRSRDPQRYVGVRATASLAERIAASASGMFTALNQEGDSVYTVFSRSPVTAWSVVIGVPAAEVDGPIRRTLLQLALAGGALLAFALTLAGLVARGIVRRRRAYEQALEKSEWRFRSFVENANDILFALTPAGLISYVSPNWTEALGYELGETVGQPFAPFVHPDDVAACAAFLRQVLASGDRAGGIEYRVRCKDGRQLWYKAKASRVQDPVSGELSLVGISRDVTELKEAEQQLSIAATAFESQEGMFITDAANVILRVNQAFTDITGYGAAEAVGQRPSLLNSGRHDKPFYARMWGALRDLGVWQGEVWNRRKNGEVYPEWLTITAVKGSAGEVTHYVATLTDITLRKAAEDEIKHLAFYDPLTRLPNRRLLLDRLRQALVSRARSGREGALLFIDLDDFKTLNDTLGHDVGDLLLQQVAERLTTCVREGDTVARLGGDEFVIMLEDLSAIPAEAATQTEAVGEKVIATLNLPYLLAGHRRRSTPSIGATLFDGIKNSVDELLKRADLAMYQAKAAGRNTLRFFDPEMQAAVTSRARLEADLHRGLERSEFLLYYQPQVDETGRLTGAEALLRWQHPQSGLILPGDFIPLAEATGLILPIGHWVLETACAQLLAWSASPATAGLTLAVNVSARQFHQPDFAAEVMAALESSGANPQRLKLELTEGLLLHDVDDVIGKMTALKAHGVSFSLDDFGTGYSSLSYLKRLPLDQLKIDQSFVRDILTEPNDAAIACIIVSLAHSMGITVIAEGVELEAQRAFLSQQNCRAFQGYLFSRPVPLAAFEALLDLA